MYAWPKSSSILNSFPCGEKSAYSLRIRAQITWNVPVYIALTSAIIFLADSSSVIRVWSSEAALSVNVASIMLDGTTRFF